MSYTIEPLDVTKTPKERVVDARPKKTTPSAKFQWWVAETDVDLMQQLLSTTEYLKKTNTQRIKQASIYSRLFSGKPLHNVLTASSSLDNSSQLPIGRPTANVVYSCTDTLVSRISQDRPKPTFLSSGGNYKERKIAEEANQFIQGEFFRVKAYDKMALQLRDACIIGNGLLKVFPKNGKVCVERTLETELLTDYNDAYYGEPTQLIQRKLVDRSVLAALFPTKEQIIQGATQGNIDQTPNSVQTVADQFIVAEGWHLPSGPDSNDGRHVIACSAGIILDEEWTKDHFPFVKLGYNPNMVGWFSQSLAEILMPCQMEIYRTLIIASQSLELMSVPRIYIDEFAEILETAFNNRIGTIIKGKGPNPPQFLNATANTPEFYQWIQWLINNAYQMAGISALSAQGLKPAGLNSGESIREFDNIQQDRFAALAKRYQNVATDLAYLMIECASDIADETGKYTTVYPGKDGLREVDFKAIKKLDDNFIIQCYEASSLPKDPAGRQAKLSEMLAAGEITNQEFRRLSDFPDLEQSDKLANALENRILYCLDEIVENGNKNFADIAPDTWLLDPTDLATTLSTNYINLYKTLGLEEEKLDVLRTWQVQVQAKRAQALTPPQPQPGPSPTSAPPGQLPPPQPPQAQVSPTSNVAV